MSVCDCLITGCLLFAFSCVTISSEDVDGYYWRDYKGVIPKDAFEAAYDNSGKPLYVGQVLHHDKLIPARIDPFVQQVAYEWGYTEYIARDKQDVKIFCTRHPEQLQWVQTRFISISNVQAKVEAGFEENATLHLGRKLFEGEYTVGKVISGSTQATLNTSKNGNVTQHGDFEVLTYNPNIKKTSNSTVISNSIEGSSCVTKQVVINYYA